MFWSARLPRGIIGAPRLVTVAESTQFAAGLRWLLPAAASCSPPPCREPPHRASPSPNRPQRAPNRFRVRLNINTGAGPAPLVDVEGEEQHVRAAVAEALSIDEGEVEQPGSQSDAARQQQHAKPQQTQQQGQRQQGQQALAGEQRGGQSIRAAAAELPPTPAKSDEQRFSEFAEAVGKCMDGTAFECLLRQADMVGTGMVDGGVRVGAGRVEHQTDTLEAGHLLGPGTCHPLLARIPFARTPMDCAAVHYNSDRSCSGAGLWGPQPVTSS